MQSKLPLIINLFGGPCIFKSTIAAELFAKLKWNKVSCELVQEVAKQKIYEGNNKSLELQFQIGFNQLYNQRIVMDNVDVVITDSPFILSNIYNISSPHLNIGFVREFEKFNNLNYLLIRKESEYTVNGRIHSYEDALAIDQKVKSFLLMEKIPYFELDADKKASDNILSHVMNYLERNKPNG